MSIENIKELEDLIKKSKTLSGITRMIKKCNCLLEILINRTNYLPNDEKITKRLYHIKYDLYNIPKCPICSDDKKWDIGENRYVKTCKNRKCSYKYNIINNPEIEKNRRIKISQSQKNKTSEEKKTIIDKIKQTNLEKYGFDCYAKTNEFKKLMIDKFGVISPFELEEIRNKSKKTLLDKTGFDHNFKIPEVKEKIKQTFIKNYGFNIPTKNPEIKEKTKKTNIKKYGAITYSQTKEYNEKVKKTNLLLFGKESYTQTDEYKERYKNTCLKKYGTEHWMQNDDNFQYFEKCLLENHKNKYKKYTLPNNEIVYVQGYEDYVLEEILLKKYNLNDIIIKNKDITNFIGKIHYEVNSKKHKYYPDFYIRSKNLIIEVKSDYTFDLDREINILKKNSCENKNIKFEYIIISNSEYRKWKTQKIKNNYEI